MQDLSHLVPEVYAPRHATQIHYSAGQQQPLAGTIASLASIYSYSLNAPAVESSVESSVPEHMVLADARFKDLSNLVVKNRVGFTVTEVNTGLRYEPLVRDRISPVDNLIVGGGDDIDPNRMTIADGYWIIFFSQRRTGIIVSAASRSEAVTKARAKKKRGGNEVKSARTVTAAERKTISNNGWVKSRPPGFKKSMRGSGPKPKAAK